MKSYSFLECAKMALTTFRMCVTVRVEYPRAKAAEMSRCTPSGRVSQSRTVAQKGQLWTALSFFPDFTELTWNARPLLPA